MTLDLLGWVLVVTAGIALLGYWVFTTRDVLRRSDLGEGAKAGWIAVVVLILVVGTAIYLLARPLPDPEPPGVYGEQPPREWDEVLAKVAAKTPA